MNSLNPRILQVETVAEAQALLNALEHAAYLAKGMGDEIKAALLWRMFDRVRNLRFVSEYDAVAEDLLLHTQRHSRGV